MVCALLTYGGVSLFVVVFAVYPFAAEMFRQSDIPKRLIPGTIALGAFTFTMDALPGTPQIQNIIPTTFFKTTTWAAPWLGMIGAVFILVVGLLYLEWRRRAAQARGEGYGTELLQRAGAVRGREAAESVDRAVAAGRGRRHEHGAHHAGPARLRRRAHEFTLPAAKPIVTQISSVAAIWAVEGALLLGILTVLAFAWRPVPRKFADGSKAAVAGALLASLNTASEYGFGGVIARCPASCVVADALQAIPNPLVNEAITVTVLAGITGSASGGMSIALAAMADTFIAAAEAAEIPLEVLHRVASMASGGMDTLPHNGAVITLLAVTGLTHRQAYRDIFAITLIKTAAVFFVIGVFYLTGIY